MSWVGDWIPVLVSRQAASLDAIAGALTELGFLPTAPDEWSRADGTAIVRYVAPSPKAGLPFDEDQPTPSAIAGWFVVLRAASGDRGGPDLAFAIARRLAEAAGSLVACADGAAFVLSDGREAKGLGHSLELLAAPSLTDDDDDDDAPIAIDWRSLPGPSLGAFVIVYRGDHLFSPRELAAALPAVGPDLEVTGAKPDDARWSQLRVTDPSLSWSLDLERGRPKAKLPFYVRARFDHGERDAWQLTDPDGSPESFTREELQDVVDAARAFDDHVAPALKLTPIDCEAK